MRAGLLACALAAVLAPSPADAEWSASLPALARCKPATPPHLPPRWRAIGLMMPLEQGQIDVGEFVYDETLSAMRATVYGLESGAVDLLITDKATYRLSGPYRAPMACQALDVRLRLPSRQWLSKRAVCIGQFRLASRDVRWWKTPGAGDQSTFHWFTAGTRLPWRSLFLRRALDPAVIGDYAMSYFPAFTRLPATRLSALLDLCRGQAPDDPPEVKTPPPTVRQLMAVGNEAAEAERAERIGKLLPGLSIEACARMNRVRWPERFIATATITPIRFAEAPYASLIYYDWRRAETQLAIMFQGGPPVLQGLISLKKRIGYRVQKLAAGGATCEAVFPGIVRPDWMSVAGCQCRGVLARGSALSPNTESQLLSCPIKQQGKRVMWNWYTARGRPLVFFEAAPSGGGVMLADYRDWIPGQTGKPEDFRLPKVCTPPERSAGLPAAGRKSTLSDASCSDCHTTPW